MWEKRKCGLRGSDLSPFLLHGQYPEKTGLGVIAIIVALKKGPRSVVGQPPGRTKGVHRVDKHIEKTFGVWHMERHIRSFVTVVQSALKTEMKHSMFLTWEGDLAHIQANLFYGPISKVPDIEIELR